MASPDVTEGLLRELLAGQATQAAKLENLSERVDRAASEAGAARDLSNKIYTILEEQDINARFSEHRSDVRQIVSEIRQDFVAANTKMRNDFEAVRADFEKRLKALEDVRLKQDGATTLIAWLMKYAPWLLAGVAAFVAGLGFKDKLP